MLNLKHRIQKSLIENFYELFIKLSIIHTLKNNLQHLNNS